MLPKEYEELNLFIIFSFISTDRIDYHPSKGHPEVTVANHDHYIMHYFSTGP